MGEWSCAVKEVKVVGRARRLEERHGDPLARVELAVAKRMV